MVKVSLRCAIRVLIPGYDERDRRLVGVISGDRWIHRRTIVSSDRWSVRTAAVVRGAQPRDCSSAPPPRRRRSCARRRPSGPHVAMVLWVTGVDAAPHGCVDSVDDHRSWRRCISAERPDPGRTRRRLVARRARPGPRAASRAGPGRTSSFDLFAPAIELAQVVDGASQAPPNSKSRCATSDRRRGSPTFVRLHVVVAHERPALRSPRASSSQARP